MNNNITWTQHTLPIAYTGSHYYGVASSAFESYNICFGGEQSNDAKFTMASYGVTPGTVPPFKDTIAINWHCIGW